MLTGVYLFITASAYHKIKHFRLDACREDKETASYS
jgi:hypothetical protein